MSEIKAGCAVRAMLQVSNAVIDELDFEPTKSRTVADMANIGNRLMDLLPKGYNWNESPAEIVTDQQNEIDGLNAKISELEKDAKLNQSKCIHIREYHEYRYVSLIEKWKCESCGAIRDTRPSEVAS